MSAVKWAFLMSWGPNVIATLLTFVLAAYLGKENYGLVGIALLYITFARILLEGGFGAAIVQRQDLEPEHLDAVFWLTMSMSAGLMMLTWIASPILARFYELPELQRVLNLESFILLFQGLTVVQQSLLEKQLDFKSLAIRSNISTLLGGLLGLGLAVKGYGVYALVWEDVGAAMVRLVLLWRLGHWRPRLKFSWYHIKDLLAFSVFVLMGADRDIRAATQRCAARRCVLRCRHRRHLSDGRSADQPGDRDDDPAVHHRGAAPFQSLAEQSRRAAEGRPQLPAHLGHADHSAVGHFGRMCNSHLSGIELAQERLGRRRFK